MKSLKNAVVLKIYTKSKNELIIFLDFWQRRGRIVPVYGLWCFLAVGPCGPAKILTLITARRWWHLSRHHDDQPPTLHPQHTLANTHTT
jgi:hypothetical protein